MSNVTFPPGSVCARAHRLPEIRYQPFLNEWGILISNKQTNRQTQKHKRATMEKD